MLKGDLYLVSTPIGNLEDITIRALRILREVDFIAAEDTRQTLKLLNYFEIKKPLTSYYEHNKSFKGSVIINRILAGESVALVSDAGTPAISDPGEDLVKEAIEAGINVIPVPGPVAAISALIISGISTGRFSFEGFLPMNKRQRKERLQKLKYEERTMIFYEAPHKLIYTLEDIFSVLGNRRIAVSREITKKFEETIRMSLEEAISLYKEKAPRGEFVILLEGVKNIDETNKNPLISIKEQYNELLIAGVEKMDAMKIIAKERGIGKRDVYKELLENG